MGIEVLKQEKEREIVQTVADATVDTMSLDEFGGHRRVLVETLGVDAFKFGAAVTIAALRDMGHLPGEIDTEKFKAAAANVIEEARAGVMLDRRMDRSIQ